MISLHKNQVKFNSNITIPHTGGRLSSDSGLVLVKEVMNTFGFSDLAKHLLHIKDNRAYFTHDNLAIFEQLIMQLIAGELLFQHVFIVTNLLDNVSPEVLFSLYAKRGTMENFIKEAKVGFYFDKTDSPRFLENHVRMMVSLLAYNLINFLKTIGFEGVNQGMTIHSLRLKFLKVAGKLVQTSRRIYLKLSSYHVYQNEFYAVFDRLRRSSQWI